jgi:hypothetical protein
MRKFYVYPSEENDFIIVGSYDEASEIAAAWAAERNGGSKGLVEYGDELDGGVCPHDSTGEGWPWWTSADE